MLHVALHVVSHKEHLSCRAPACLMHMLPTLVAHPLHNEAKAHNVSCGNENECHSMHGECMSPG